MLIRNGARVACGLLLFVFPLVAEQPSNESSGKCTIEGVVTKATTGEPLKKAWVILTNLGARQQSYSATSDAGGNFTIRGIEPGRYRLHAERSGYAREEYGQLSPNRPGTTLTLAPGQSLKGLALRMIPAAVITGHVYDEDGEPLAGVSVEPLRYRYSNGRRQMFGIGGGAQSNDLGEYRIYDLPPGDYYLSATPLRKGYAGIALGRAHLPTYYPGTSDPATAGSLTAQAGQELSGIDFNLQTLATVRVRGRVASPVGGRSLRGTHLMLVERELRGIAPVRIGPSAQTSVDDTQGTFTIAGVRPGSYTLVARHYDDGKLYSAREPIEVGNTDVEGVSVTLSPGAELRGRIRVEGKGAEALTDLHLHLQPLDDGPPGVGSSEVKDDGAFRVANVGEGNYAVRVSGLPEDFYLKSARLTGNDVLENGLTVTGGEPSGLLELVISPGGGRVAGSVVNEGHQAFGGAQVVLVPEARLMNRDDLYRATSADENGAFLLRGVPPGEYTLFAFEDIEPGAYRDPELLRRYRDRGKTVRVTEGLLGNAQLEVIPAAKGLTP